MITGNIFVVAFLVYYSYYIFSLFDKNKRKKIKKANKKLNNLRKIQCKTIEEQKKFLDLKYPKGKCNTITIKSSALFILKILLLIIIFQLYYKALSFVIIPFWIGIVFIIVFPVILNFVFRKFGLQKNDISVYFR